MTTYSRPDGPPTGRSDVFTSTVWAPCATCAIPLDFSFVFAEP